MKISNKTKTKRKQNQKQKQKKNEQKKTTKKQQQKTPPPKEINKQINKTGETEIRNYYNNQDYVFTRSPSLKQNTHPGWWLDISHFQVQSNYHHLVYSCRMLVSLLAKCQLLASSWLVLTSCILRLMVTSLRAHSGYGHTLHV